MPLKGPHSLITMRLEKSFMIINLYFSRTWLRTELFFCPFMLLAVWHNLFRFFQALLVSTGSVAVDMWKTTILSFGGQSKHYLLASSVHRLLAVWALHCYFLLTCSWLRHDQLVLASCCSPDGVCKNCVELHAYCTANSHSGGRYGVPLLQWRKQNLGGMLRLRSWGATLEDHHLSKSLAWQSFEVQLSGLLQCVSFHFDYTPAKFHFWV